MRFRFTYALAMVLVISAFAYSLWVDAQSIDACECGETISTDERLNEASAVFLGRVTRMHFEDWPFDIDSADVPPDEPLTVEFSVRTVWKGEVPQTMRLTTARSAGCGYPFDNHVDYVVYANGEQGALEVRPCSQTKPHTEAREDLEALGEGMHPNRWRKGSSSLQLSVVVATLTPKPHALIFVSWPLGLIAGIAWVGIRKRRRSR